MTSRNPGQDFTGHRRDTRLGVRKPGMCKSQRLLEIFNPLPSRQQEQPRRPEAPYNGMTYGNPAHPAEMGARVAGRGGICRYARFDSLLHSLMASSVTKRHAIPAAPF